MAAPGAKCDARYGNAPRPITGPDNGRNQITQLCLRLQGENLDWTDADGTPRAACLLKGTATERSPRPLLVWLHPSLFSMDSITATDLLPRQQTADLSGDPTRPGFALLLVGGRDTEHYYVSPDDKGLGWDNWYRNLDRRSTTLNVDVATIDHFIAEVKGRGLVDPNRVYLSGWSNGAAMAEMYALNTPGIAAVAVYSSPNPFHDSNDPCPQQAFGNHALPFLHVGNQCDIVGICDTSEALMADLRARHLAMPVQGIRLGNALEEVQGCSAMCKGTVGPGASSSEAAGPGTVNHFRWPVPYTTRMLDFLRDHPAR